MPTDSGNQEVTLKFYDPVDSHEVNERQRDIVPVGVYKGGYCAKTNDTTVALSPLVCEVRSKITSPYYQVKIETTSEVAVTVSNSTTYVVMRWSYTGVAADDFGEMLGVASPDTYDIVIAKCTFSGATLTGFDYSFRSNPEVVHLFGKVEPEEAPSMYVRIRAGRFQIGNQTVHIADQLSGAFSAPGGADKVGAVYVTVGGAIAVSSDFDQEGELVLAEIALTNGQTTIDEDDITDVRPFLTPAALPDGTSIEYDSNGKLAQVPHTHVQLHDEVHEHDNEHTEAHTHTLTNKYLLAWEEGIQIHEQINWTKFTWQDNIVKASGISYASSTFTLLANVRYRIAYNILGNSTTSKSPRLRARFRRVSGDSSWDLENRSFTLSEAGDGILVGEDVQLFWSGIIIPSSNTVIQVEGISKDPDDTDNFGQFHRVNIEVDAHYYGGVA